MAPAEARTSEKVLNGALAAALNGCHPRWRVEAEQSGVVRGAPGRSPDLVITAGDGLAAAPVVIETEYEPARTVEADAAARLGAVLSRSGQTVEQAVAVAVPEALSRAPQRDLPGEIEAAGLRYRLATRYGAAAGQSWFPSEGWLTGTVADLAGLCEQLTTNDLVVESAATVMEDSVAAVSNNLARAFSDKPQVLAGVAAALNLQPSEQTTRIGVTMIANALLFQLAIEGGVNPETGWRIPGPSAEAPRDRVLEVWWRILDVNYWPIFWTAHAVLSQIPQAEAHAEVLAPLTGMAHELARFGAASTADIAGQMFGKLIADRKFLATFYTRPSSARLLAELAVDRLAVDWSDPERVESLRVADLACGTGSLLTAAYQQIASRVRRIGGLDDEALHPAMMEQVLAGADIMPAAAHLTCTALSSTHPRTRFSRSRIHLMPYGRSPDASGSGHHVRLGALELLDRSYRQTSWLDTAEIAVDPEGGAGNGAGPAAGPGANGAGPAAGPGANGPEPLIDHAGADLVIMNPPFTRPTNHGTAEAARMPVPSFAGFDTEAAEQRAMSRRLAKLNRGLADPAGSGNAGLASNFVDLAHAKVKPGGAIAFVLPAVMTAGQAWSKVRALLDEHYRNICVVAIADTGPTDRSFSADTGMAEVLVVADRARPDDEPDPDSWLWVNLSARPPNPVEAAETARLIARIASEPSHRRSGALNLGGARIGNYVRDGVGAAGCAGIAEPDLGRLRRGHGLGQAVAGPARADRRRSPDRAGGARLAGAGRPRRQRRPVRPHHPPRPVRHREDGRLASRHLSGAVVPRPPARDPPGRGTRLPGPSPRRLRGQGPSHLGQRVAAALQPRLPAQLAAAGRLSHPRALRRRPSLACFQTRRRKVGGGGAVVGQHHPRADLVLVGRNPPAAGPVQSDRLEAPGAGDPGPAGLDRRAVERGRRHLRPAGRQAAPARQRGLAGRDPAGAGPDGAGRTAGAGRR